MRRFLLWLALRPHGRSEADEAVEETMKARERILEELRAQEPMFYIDGHGNRWAAPGLFSRIARDLGVSTGYVSQVAKTFNVKGGVGRPRKAA